GVRKDVTPPLGPQAPEAAAREAALTDPPQLTQAEMVEHLLSRVTFGARPRDRAAMGDISRFIEDQLHPERLDDGELAMRLDFYDVLQRDSSSLVQELSELRMKRKEGDAPAGRRPGFDFVAQLAE